MWLSAVRKPKRVKKMGKKRYANCPSPQLNWGYYEREKRLGCEVKQYALCKKEFFKYFTLLIC